MDEDTNRGRPPKASDGEIASVFIEADEPFLSTQEVADELPIGFSGTIKRLESLETDGILRSKMVAGSNVWWHQQVDATHAWAKNEDERGEVDNSTPGPIGVPLIDKLDVPGSGEDDFNRRLSINAVFRRRFRDTEAERTELMDLAWDSSPYNTYDSEESLWNNCIIPALNQSIFFSPRGESQKWILAELGKWIVNTLSKDEIWTDWPTVRSRLESHISEKIAEGILASLNRSNYRQNRKMGPTDKRLHYLLKLDDEPYLVEFSFSTSTWQDGEIGLSISLTVQGSPEIIDQIMDQKATLDKAFEEDLIWDQENESLRIILPLGAILTPNSTALAPSDRENYRPPVENPQTIVEKIKRFDSHAQQIIPNP